LGVEFRRRSVTLSIARADPVSVDQTLFQVDDALRRIELDEAKASAERAAQQFEMAKANYEHTEGLSPGASNPMELTEARTRYQAARADKDRAESAVEKAALMLDRAEVKSTIDGVVNRVFVEEGEFVQTGMPLVEVIAVDRLELIVLVEDVHVVWVAPGLTLSLTTAARPGESFEGRVRRVFPQATPNSRKFEVEIEVPNGDDRLKPGFFMEAELIKPVEDTAQDAPLRLVPKLAVFRQFGQTYCFVLNNRGAAPTVNGDVTTVEQRAVEVVSVPAEPQVFQVIRGLEAGDVVVTKGRQHLAHGSNVRVDDSL